MAEACRILRLLLLLLLHSCIRSLVLYEGLVAIQADKKAALRDVTAYKSMATHGASKQ